MENFVQACKRGNLPAAKRVMGRAGQLQLNEGFEQACSYGHAPIVQWMLTLTECYEGNPRTTTLPSTRAIIAALDQGHFDLATELIKHWEDDTQVHQKIVAFLSEHYATSRHLLYLHRWIGPELRRRWDWARLIRHICHYLATWKEAGIPQVVGRVVIFPFIL